jgi:alpha-aminoadipic semialdehyde synthase
VTKNLLRKLWSGSQKPRLRVVGDISCDVDGSMECTIKCTTPAQPVFTYDVDRDDAVDGFAGHGPVVMAVDNLPAEISLESSIYFSQTLKPFIAALAAADFKGEFAKCDIPPSLRNAVILFRGEFTPGFQYMRDFLHPSKRSHP